MKSDERHEGRAIGLSMGGRDDEMGWWNIWDSGCGRVGRCRVRHTWDMELVGKMLTTNW